MSERNPGRIAGTYKQTPGPTGFVFVAPLGRTRKVSDFFPSTCPTWRRNRDDSCRRITVVETQCRRGSGSPTKSRGNARRPNRVAELIRREISPIISDAFSRSFVLEEVQHPVLVSVVDVKCSDDLRSARVSVSVLGTDEQRQDALLWLRKTKKEIRFELAQSVHLKYIPDLTFSESEMGAAVKTINIIDRLAQEREKKSELMEDQFFEDDRISRGVSQSLARNTGESLESEKRDTSSENWIDLDQFIHGGDEARELRIVDIGEEEDEVEKEDEGDGVNQLFNPDSGGELKR